MANLKVWVQKFFETFWLYLILNNKNHQKDSVTGKNGLNSQF
jgi:hypothetical protein